MNIYEIDNAIAELIENSVDPETGELLIDDGALDALQMERDAKVENLALYIKNTVALADSIRQEEKVLAERRRSAERKVERLKNYLTDVLGGSKFATSRVACTFRSSTSVEIDDAFREWAERYNPELLRYKAPEADKAAIKAALKNGEEIPHAALVTNQSLSNK